MSENCSNSVSNPFMMSARLDMVEKVKIAVLAVLLLPIRACILGICICMSGIVGYICNMGLKDDDFLIPFTGWRRSAQNCICLLSRIALFSMGFHWIKIKGKFSNAKEAPITVMAPHSSFIDGLVTISLSRLTFLSRKENGEAPILGHAVRAFQPVYVTRGHLHSRQETIQRVVDRAKSDKDWPQICVFPEGTCTNGKCLITFKLGAFYAGVPVQPVIFRYLSTTDCVTWTWIGPSTLKQMFKLMCQLNNNMEVEILPVYQPNEKEQADPLLYAENVRLVMAKALGVPISQHSFDDCRLMTEAEKRRLPAEAGIVEYCKTSAQLGMGFEKMRKLLHIFADIDTNCDGLVTIKEFSEYLSLPSDNSLQELFQSFDREDNNYFDFKSFLFGYASLQNKISNSKSPVADDYKEQLSNDIDDNALRNVFKHLYEKKIE
eukprot:gene7140-7945_t